MPDKVTPLNRFVFHHQPAHAADQRVLDRFAVSHGYDCLTHATQAERAAERLWRSLNQLLDAEQSLLGSGLIAPQHVPANQRRIELLEERMSFFQPILNELRQDRRERLEEIATLEEALRQRARLADKPKKKAASKTKRQLLPPEEPTAPGLNLDPEVLAAAVRSLGRLR